MICPLPTSLSPEGCQGGRAPGPPGPPHVVVQVGQCTSPVDATYITLEFCRVQPAQLYGAALGSWKVWLGKGRKDQDGQRE